MTYRPEGWDNPYNEKYKRKPWTEWFQSDAEIAYEAGASAMLRAIWKLAKESPTGIFTFDSNFISAYRNFTNIPDDTGESK